MTLFCDFDGPIVDVSGRYYSTYCLALARTRRDCATRGEALRLTPMAREQFWQMKQARVPDSEIALRSGLSGDQISTFLTEVKALVNCCPALLRRDRPQPEVKASLESLQHQGFSLVLVTLRCETQVLAFLEQYGLRGLFDGVYGTQDKQAAYQNYTDVKTALLSQALVELAPETAWMIGDTEADLVAAQRMGLPAIALTCGIRSKAYLRALKPQALYSSLASLTQEMTAALAEQG